MYARAFLSIDIEDTSVAGSKYLVLHLHRFEYKENLSALEAVSDLYVDADDRAGHGSGDSLGSAADFGSGRSRSGRRGSDRLRRFAALDLFDLYFVRSTVNINQEFTHFDLQ